MKMLVLSDLHFEFWDEENFSIEKSTFDAVVLAGDINLGLLGLNWAVEKFPATPVLYVAGNHEFHLNSFERLGDRSRDFVKGSNVHYLEDESVVINGIRFLGSTLWTNFKLHENDNQGQNIRKAHAKLSDYRKIFLDGIEDKQPFIQGLDVLERHQNSIKFLKKELESSLEPCVVITHHAPSKKSLKSLDSPTAACYASDQEKLMEEFSPNLWIHGHTHHSCDYMIAQTRVISNPCGYPNLRNDSFNSKFVVEI